MPYGGPMTTPRIAPGSRTEIGLVNHLLSTAAGRTIGSGRPNVFTTLGRRRGLFRAWLLYSATMMPGGRLPRTDTELVILHVATVRECAYERRHHERIGARVGLSRAEIEHAGDVSWSGWSDRQRILLTATDELVRTRGLGEDTWASLRGILDEVRAIEWLMLCGHYDALATTLLTLRVQPD